MATTRAGLFVLLTFITTLTVELTGTAPAHAQGFIIPELGSRMNGMGAAIGRPDEVSAVYHNPAALAVLPGTNMGLSFGATILRTDVRLAPWQGSEKLINLPAEGGYYPRQTPTIFAPLPFIGASTKLWTEKVAAGVGIYVPNAAGASFGADAASRYHIVDAYVFSSYFTLAVAYRPWSWLAIGGGASAVYIRVQRTQLLYPVINGQDWSAMLGPATEINLEGSDVRPAFSLGIQAWPHRTVSLGFMMLSGHKVELEGPLKIKTGPGSAEFLNAPSFTDNQQVTAVTSPWIFGWGANWDITPWLEVGAEFRFYLNSQVKEQKTTITQGDVLKQMLPDGLVTPKNYHDSIKAGGGFKVRPPLRKVDLDLMTGMHFDSSASPANTVDVAAPSFDLFAYHLGARWNIKRMFRLSLFYSHYWYLERTTTDSITSPPANLIGSGDAHMITLVFDVALARAIGVRAPAQ